MATVKQTAIRLTPDDLAIIEALRAKTGILSTTELIRMSIRALAESLGVEAAKRKRRK